MDVLAETNEWALTGVLFLALLLAWELAYRVGTRVAGTADDGYVGQVTTIQGSVLGLVGLLLAFSFQMSEQRYEERRQLVLNEANAIGTAYLRAGVLPSPADREVQERLRHYVDARLDFFRAGVDPARLRAALDHAQALQTECWARVSAEVRQDPHAVGYGLVMQALNDVIDLDAKRQDALENHVPLSVLLLLFLACIPGVATVGYGFGLVRRRQVVAMLLLSGMMAGLVAVILDLDRPRRGLTRVSQEAMLQLRENLAKAPPTAPPGPAAR